MTKKVYLEPEAVALKDTILKITQDTVTELAGGTFAEKKEVLVTREKLESIMAAATIRGYEFGVTGIYQTPYPSLPKSQLN